MSLSVRVRRIVHKYLLKSWKRVKTRTVRRADGKGFLVLSQIKLEESASPLITFFACPHKERHIISPLA